MARRPTFWQRLTRNRYDPRSHWLTLYDVWLNLKEEGMCWWYRVAPGSHLLWRRGKIRSYITRRP
ncbi:MAG TPA: hypothetical protein VI431_09660 [Candidatus Acidoferrum sp.]